MMRAATGLKDNLGRLLFAKEGFNLTALEFAPQRRAILLINAMEGEHMLGRIDRNALKLHGDGPSLEYGNPTLA